MAEFLITGTVHGEFSMTVEAESEQEAREKAERVVEDDLWSPMLDTCDDVFVGHVQRLTAAPATRGDT